MSVRINAIIYHEHGDPPEAVRVEIQALPTLGPTDALVEIKAAPIHPVDLNVIEGKYPVRPSLPSVAGTEGAGIITEVGSEVQNLSVGMQVLLPQGIGTWRQACVIPAKDLVVVPSRISPVQAAMLRINPATAWRMLHDFVELKPGDWVMQNAANSAVGRAIIQIAKKMDLKTINIVRRAELIDELKSEGGDLVLCEGENLPDHVSELTKGARIFLGLNAVGGESALNIANALAPGATIVTYGAMGRKPMRIPNGLLIFKDLRWRGFWITQWYQNASSEAKNEMFHSLFEMAQRGFFKITIEKAYSFSECKEALKHAQQSRRSGKIIFEA